MRSNFEISLAAVEKIEGGYVNDPLDKGGPTNRGITQAVYDKWCENNNRQKQSVKFIHPEEIRAIYLQNYWIKGHCDNYPVGLDYAVFDWEVNSGILRAETAIHAVMNLHPNISVNALIDLYMDERLAFLKRLSNWNHFGNGWTNRINKVRALAHKMANGTTIVLPPPVGKAPLAPKVIKKTTQTQTTKGSTKMDTNKILNALPHAGLLGAVLWLVQGQLPNLTALLPTASGGSNPIAWALGLICLYLLHFKNGKKIEEAVVNYGPVAENFISDPQVKAAIDMAVKAATDALASQTQTAPK